MPKSRSKRNPQAAPAGPAPAKVGALLPGRDAAPWHRAVGWTLIGIGVVVIVVNDLAYADIELMPGGHSELHLFLGLLVAGAGSWWTGLFNRP